MRTTSLYHSCRRARGELTTMNTKQVSIAPVDFRVMSAVVERLRCVEDRLRKGKGTWPNDDYVRDHVWDGWIGQSAVLRGVLSDAGFSSDDINALARHAETDGKS
jgi:hypothetical protein